MGFSDAQSLRTPPGSSRYCWHMSAKLDQILSLEVPIIVRLGEKRMPLGDILAMTPGAIIELPKSAEDELDLLVNNKPIGSGTAVKVGENFGLRLSFVGDVSERVRALGQQREATGARRQSEERKEDEMAAMTAQMLAGL